MGPNGIPSFWAWTKPQTTNDTTSARRNLMDLTSNYADNFDGYRNCKENHHGSRRGPITFNQRTTPKQIPRTAEPKGAKRLPRGCNRTAAISAASAPGMRRYGKSHCGKPMLDESLASSFGSPCSPPMEPRSQRAAQRTRKVANHSVGVTGACNRSWRRCHSQKNPTMTMRAVAVGPPAVTNPMV